MDLCMTHLLRRRMTRALTKGGLFEGGPLATRACTSLALAVAVLSPGVAQAQSSWIIHDAFAETYCADVRDDPPEFKLNNGGPEMLVRHPMAALARSADGSYSRTSGGVRMGVLSPLRVVSRAAELTPGCQLSGGRAYGTTMFIDNINVTAGDLPPGTPVTYTATVDLPVRIHQTGTGCIIPPFLQATVGLQQVRSSWTLNDHFNGTHRLTTSFTTAVGETLEVVLHVLAIASSSRASYDDWTCDMTSVRLLDSARVVLTADVPEANMVSVNGVRYDKPR
jgi:hypothetical protein